MQITRFFKCLLPSPDLPCSRLSLITFVYYVPSEGRGCEYKMCYNDLLPDSTSLRQTDSSFNFLNVCWCCFPVCMCICIKFLYSISVLFFLIYNPVLSKFIFMSRFWAVISTMFLLKVKEFSLLWMLPNQLATILNQEELLIPSRVEVPYRDILIARALGNH